MKFLNESEIEMWVWRNAEHPVLGPASRFLRDFKDEVNAHSDGWAYWSPPIKSAAKLMALVEQRDATEAEFRKALGPIKGFMTRRGLKAGMTLPEVK